MKSLVNVVSKFLGYFCMVLFALLVLTTTWQVFSRLVLNSPVTWSEELAKVLFVWLSFLGSALVYGERGHMAVEYVARKMPPKGERAMALWTHAVSLLFAALTLVYGGIRAVQNAWTQNLTALPVNIGSIYIVIPIAGVAIMIYAIYYLITIASGEESTYPIPESELVIAEGEDIAREAEAEQIVLDETELGGAGREDAGGVGRAAKRNRAAESGGSHRLDQSNGHDINGTEKGATK